MPHIPTPERWSLPPGEERKGMRAAKGKKAKAEQDALTLPRLAEEPVSITLRTAGA